ncbi:hypothetical protein [Streptomyces sp. NPDC088736]
MTVVVCPPGITGQPRRATVHAGSPSPLASRAATRESRADGHQEEPPRQE